MESAQLKVEWIANTVEGIGVILGMLPIGNRLVGVENPAHGRVQD